jgi:class 3 adenylate cyclase
LAESNAFSQQLRLARFPASILFVDIVGFTPLVERLTREGQEGVERLSRLLNTFFGELIDLIAAFGGVVVKFTGDGMIAIWPIREGCLGPRRDHSEAVHCACALQEKMNNR